MDSTMMRKISKTAAMVTLVLGMTGYAEAATSPLTFSSCGSESCASFSSKVKGAFSNDYTFSLSSLSDFDMIAFGSMKVKKSLPAPITDLTVSLWRYSSPTTTEHLADATSFSSYAWDLEYSNLSAGDYFVRLAGNAGSSGKYQAAVQVALAPVPEASTWIMMLLGVGLVGLALHRKTEANGELIAV